MRWKCASSDRNVVAQKKENILKDKNKGDANTNYAAFLQLYFIFVSLFFVYSTVMVERGWSLS